jgi:tRNA uridine 5-carbamoylmethylation protein Kti12
MITVINLFGGPGVGKSTTAAGLFHLMKLDKDFSKVELITEYAKRLVWAERHKEMSNQVYITAKQSHRLDLIKDQVDYAITDSPILLGLIYTPENYLRGTYREMVIELFNSYNNVNFLINRVKPYMKLGREQTENEADFKADKIRDLLEELKIPYTTVNGDRGAPTKIFDSFFNSFTI